MVALCLGAGVYGSSLGAHVTQSGFFDDGSESAQASRLGDQVYGRDTSGHIVAIYTAPDDKTVSEKYLPPTNSVRQAQEEFDKTFPGFRVEPITLVIQSSDDRPVTNAQVALVRSEALAIPGFAEPNNDPANM